MNENKKILIGKVVAAQGMRGEVRIHSFTEKPSDLADLKIENVNLKFIRAKGSDMAICKVDGVDDRTAAEGFRGTELFINRDDLPGLSDDRFYHTDLIGMKVISKNGNDVRTVTMVQNFGAGDILELDNGDMISFANVDVDLKNGKIIIK